MLVVETSSTYTSIRGRYGKYNRGSLSHTHSNKQIYKAFDAIEQVDVAWHELTLASLLKNDQQNLFQYYINLKKIHNPHILTIKDVWINEKNTLCYITDINSNYTIRQYYQTHRPNLYEIKQICKQLLTALSYLHKRNIFAVNIQTNNIYVDYQKNIKITLNISDSMPLSSIDSVGMLEFNWNIYHSAPELYTETCNEKMDIWSFGICILELITSRMPYAECKNAVQLYQTISASKKPQDLYKINDPYVRDFIEICLEYHHSNRPTAKELLVHPFLLIKDNDKNRCNEHLMMNTYELFFHQCVNKPTLWKKLTDSDNPLQLETVDYNKFPFEIQLLLRQKQSDYETEYGIFLQIQSELLRLKLEQSNRYEQMFVDKIKRKIESKKNELRTKWKELIEDQKEIMYLQKIIHKMYSTDKVKAELLVNAYVDCHTKILDNYTRHYIFCYIPPAIRFIMYSYYLLTEQWNTELSRFVIIDENKCKTTQESKMCLHSKHNGGTVFGVNAITEGRHKWIFKTPNMFNMKYSMNIGIERERLCKSQKKKRIQHALPIPYVANIYLTVQNNNIIHVELRVTVVSKTASIHFEFDPSIEKIENVIEEMFDESITFHGEPMNHLRKEEIVKSFKIKFNELFNENSLIHIQNENMNEKDTNEEQDTIEMIFDFDTKTLKYIVNGSDYGTVTMKGLKYTKSKSFRMGVTFNGHPNKIEIIDYMQLK
eukprot:317795_1